jgi:hypothetical protein
MSTFPLKLIVVSLCCSRADPFHFRFVFVPGQKSCFHSPDSGLLAHEVVGSEFPVFMSHLRRLTRKGDGINLHNIDCESFEVLLMQVLAMMLEGLI